MAHLMAVAVAAGGAGNAGRRAQNKKRHSSTTEEDLKRAIRLTENEVNILAAEYNQWRGQKYGIHANTDVSYMSMLEFLSYLARGGFFHQVALAYGIAKSTAIAHIHDVAEFFAKTAYQHIELPRLTELPGMLSPLEGYNVVLYIDGFIVKIQRPDHAGDAFFCGRHGKSCDSINVQYVSDKSGRIRHIITGISGATHDKTAAGWSAEFMAFLDNLPAGYVVLGDPAYRGLHQKIMTTYTGANLTPYQINFNYSCTRLRQIIERTIGASQLKWRVQQLKENRLAAKSGVIFPAQCTLAAAVLHNRFTNFL